jgi:L,D-transpeptidase YcbB
VLLFSALECIMRAVWLPAATLRNSCSALALLLMSSYAAAQMPPEQTPPPQPIAAVDVLPTASVPYSEVPAPAAATDKVTAALRRKLAEPGPKSGFDTQERTALAAYYATDGAKPLWVAASNLTPRALALNTELARADDWGLQASAFDVGKLVPRDTSDDALADAEIRISLAALKYARFAKGGRVDPSQLSRSLDQKPKLPAPATVLTGLASAEAPDAYLRSLHPQHPQFEKLRQALLVARNKPPATETAAPAKGKTAVAARSTVQHLTINLERWRWMPEELGSMHIWNNLPEQQTRVIKNGKIIHQEAIIIGRTVSPTPVFSADMQFVIFHPSWGVPEGIKTNEIGPALRRASSSASFLDSPAEPAILRRHNLKVSLNGKPVDASQINWREADIRQFQFTQPPSVTNVLGVVKFRFPNKHDVYMHDTPERSLFQKSERMFSHGCMRVQNPQRLAEIILAEDRGTTSAQVRSYIAHASTNDIKLNKPLPVHVTYFTAVAQDDGSTKTFPDYYGHDARIAAALDGKSVPLIAANDPAAKSTRVVRRSSPTKTASNDNGSIGGFFSGLFGN